MLKKSELQAILGHALTNNPYHFYGNYVHGFTGYFSAVNGCDLELCITHSGSGTWLSAVLYEKFIDLNGKPNLTDYKRYYGRPNKAALAILRGWLPVECRGDYWTIKEEVI